MFKSMQWKIVLMYSLLILFAMQFFGFYLLQGIEEYYLNDFSASLETQGELLASFVRRHLVDEQAELYIHDLVKGFGLQAGTEIMVLDGFGRVISSNNEDTELLGRRIVHQEVTRALTGHKSEDLRIVPDTNQRSKYLALPVKSGQNVVGVIYLVGSLEGLDNTLGQIRRILLTGGLLVMTITACLGFVLAKTITVPIQFLTSKAEKMASGDFSQKIIVKEDDEIGQLGMMFNHLAQQLDETLKEISSEKSKSEAILNYMTDGILAFSRQGILIHMNPAAQQMLGIHDGQPVEEYANKLLIQMFPQGDYWSSMEEKEQLVSEFTWGEQEEKVLKAFFAPFKTREGSLTGFLVVLHNITRERKLSQLQQEFVANVSHELRTPLTTIKSYVEALVENPMDDRNLQSKFLRVVKNETDRMVRLVQDLLTLSRLDYRQVRWKKEWVDIKKLAEETVELAAVELEELGIFWSIKFPNYLPPLYLDRDRIKQVLLNLLNNAQQYTPSQGSITLEIEVETDKVIISLEDTGCGIPEEDLPRVFERFYRVDKTRSRDYGGTGLGLPIARQIIEAHGGQMIIVSNLDQGTRVSFILPQDLDQEEGDKFYVGEN
ncbi:ATP-binding protein [Candidatus Contubernalis alkaliaceticus]|uniref:ATP-binding protein n=1 Tax=Candidatus Contubernalis alkaliaceticus TaxID=338645 RepID=UPI001F4BDB60|nr:ATP-binding protein [Candidatus Contubernalis alkalaceticus]UNC93703.1 HAMP domain-containing protein [Candidatus Contubernalis alkalaceticus]